MKFKQPIRPGDVGTDVKAEKRALWKALGKVAPEHRKPMTADGKQGKRAVENLKTFQTLHKLKPDGIYGPGTHKKLDRYYDAWGRVLYHNAKIRPHSKQIPPLPKAIFFPGSSYPPTQYRYGVQPWIVPQIEAIAKKFNLRVTDGWGTHPPHGFYSDHRWGGAVDLAGSLADMQRANIWADGLRGRVFRWVGGPAHDADGVEHGHGNHVHLSWFRYKPTTIFGTKGFQ